MYSMPNKKDFKIFSNLFLYVVVRNAIYFLNLFQHILKFVQEFWRKTFFTEFSNTIQIKIQFVRK